MIKDFLLVSCGALFVGASLLGAAKFPQYLDPAEETPVFAEVNEPLQVLFVGDIMLDRSVAKHAAKVGDAALFAGVEELFEGPDIIVGNLEGTITDNESISQQNNKILRFTFDPRFAKFLRDAGFAFVSLANNHAGDFYNDGFEQTLKYLDEAGVISFGSPLNTERLSAAISRDGQVLCFVGYHELFKRDPTAVLAEIEHIRPLCTYVIVMPHWGVEYSHQPNLSQRELAYAFIEAGADLIIGSHPHVVQPIELYKNGVIFYSLGNFLFDQGFRPEVKRGLAVEVEFLPDNMRFTLTPVATYLESSMADATTTEAVLADVGAPRVFEVVK